MKRPLSILAAQLWGVACGGVFGALRTREEALHLLAKDRALEAVGVFPLPGNGHWETLASWAPAGAGSLFFGLSLGLGLATLVAFWCRACGTLASRGLATGVAGAPNAETRRGLLHHIRRQGGRWLGKFGPWAALAIPAWAAARGDATLATGLAVLVIGVVWSQAGGFAPPSRAIVLRVGLLLWFLPALILWARAPEGPFTRPRDQWLLPTPVGSLINEFYYRWTLYPAEALKPLIAKSQPTAWVTDEVPPNPKESFCTQARELGLLCVDAVAAADCIASEADGTMVLMRGSVRKTWPKNPGAQRDAWKAFSQETDRAVALRKATAMSLFFGCPLALCWALSSLAVAAGDLFGRGWRRALAAHVAAVFLAGSLFSAGLPDPARMTLRETLERSPVNREEILRYTASANPVERFYAIRAAGRASGNEALLMQALSDPVINIRYAAAEALGRTGGSQAQEALQEILISPEAWYVKERAYAGLWRLGWRPK